MAFTINYSKFNVITHLANILKNEMYPDNLGIEWNKSDETDTVERFSQLLIATLSKYCDYEVAIRSKIGYGPKNVWGANPFQVVFPKNGVFGVVDGGPSTAVADRFFILTKPLSEYIVQFKSSLSSPSYASDVTYHLNAK